MVKKPAKPKSFRDPVEPETRAERLLADCVVSGEIADVSGFEVDTEKEVRAVFLRGLCLNAENLNVDPRGIWLRGAKVTGILDLYGAILDRSFWFANCIFTDRPSLTDAKGKSLGFSGCTLPAIEADRLVLEGSLSFTGATMTGGTRLLSAKVGGQVRCADATFANKGGEAFSADGLEVGRDLSFDGATVIGETRLLGAKVGGDVNIIGAVFTNEGGEAFSADGLEIMGRLFFRNMRAPVIGAIRLNHASVDSLIADGSGWSEPGLLDLDGFRYRTLGVYHPWTTLLGWIERQSPKGFAPQPYEQAMKVYREAGHLADAREMGIAKMEAYRKYGDLSPAERVWFWIAGPLIKYGYKPWRALYAALFVFVISVFFFSYAFDAGHMEPSKERVYLHDCYQFEKPAQPCAGWERPARWWVLASPYRLPVDYPAFNPITYSLDTIIPIVDLHQESYWLPRDTRPGGWVFRAWHWLHIGLGWMLTTLFVTGLTGIVKKD